MIQQSDSKKMHRKQLKRIVLKISGEALMGDQKFGFDQDVFQKIAESIKEVHQKGIQIGLVVGGGNIFRGSQASALGLARTPGDHIGMLATTINGLILQQFLTATGITSHVMSALNTDSIVENYVWAHAMQYLQNHEVVIFVGGTGNPYFTTDTAAALRASEINAEMVLKATKVDGIYSDDPLKNPKAVKYSHLTYSEVLTKKLNVMDATAIALCRENQIPICVFNLFEKGALLKAVMQKEVGSIVMGE
ncbi:MAG TPA: UMP kinase [Rhabdochlamydiaceae bacterium]|nr:UMP kinase [Rhabdochlamydiaceae bacterium]